MSRNKSFQFIVGFGAMYSASKTKEYSLKNGTIGNRLLLKELANIEIRTLVHVSLLQSNALWKFQDNWLLNFERLSSYWLLHQRFLRNVYCFYQLFLDTGRYLKFQSKISATLIELGRTFRFKCFVVNAMAAELCKEQQISFGNNIKYSDFNAGE